MSKAMSKTISKTAWGQSELFLKKRSLAEN